MTVRMAVEITANVDGQLGIHRFVVGGQDISRAITSGAIFLDPGDLPRVNVDLQVWSQQLVDGEAEVVVSDETARALVLLGWTPPPNLDQDQAESG